MTFCAKPDGKVRVRKAKIGWWADVDATHQTLPLTGGNKKTVWARTRIRAAQKGLAWKKGHPENQELAEDVLLDLEVKKAKKQLLKDNHGPQSP